MSQPFTSTNIAAQIAAIYAGPLSTPNPATSAASSAAPAALTGQYAAPLASITTLAAPAPVAAPPQPAFPTTFLTTAAIRSLALLPSVCAAVALLARQPNPVKQSANFEALQGQITGQLLPVSKESRCSLRPSPITTSLANSPAGPSRSRRLQPSPKVPALAVARRRRAAGLVLTRDGGREGRGGLACVSGGSVVCVKLPVRTSPAIRARCRALFHQELADLYAQEARELKEEERRASKAWLKKMRKEEEKEIEESPEL